MIEDIISSLSVKNVVVGFFSVLLLINVFQRIADERKIRSLGHHTRYIRNYLPFSKLHLVFPAHNLVLVDDVQL